MSSLYAVHFSCAFLSVAGFALRWWWMLTENPRLQMPAAKRLPHVVDSVLLGSAIGMLMEWRIWPWEMGWIMAKITALILYIVLGMIALRFGRTRRQRTIAGALALTSACYIVTVALTKNPMGFFAPFLA